jgi:hypothetical protein
MKTGKEAFISALEIIEKLKHKDLLVRLREDYKKMESQGYSEWALEETRKMIKRIELR